MASSLTSRYHNLLFQIVCLTPDVLSQENYQSCIHGVNLCNVVGTEAFLGTVHVKSHGSPHAMFMAVHQETSDDVEDSTVHKELVAHSMLLKAIDREGESCKGN